MPTRPLPSRIIRWLRQPRRSQELLENLWTFKNIDHRHVRRAYAGIDPKKTEIFGLRVRQARFQGFRQPVVLKRAMDITAQETLKLVRKRVDDHNRQFASQDYLLKKPFAYAISDDLIAMSKTDRPSVDEILGQYRVRGTRTVRGARFLEKIKSLGISKERLRQATAVISARTGIDSSNLLVLGVKKGKIVFMPLVDHN